MKKTPLKITADQFIAAAIRATKLERELGITVKTPDPIPEGYRKRADWQRIWRCSNTNASYIIKEHLNTGRMKMKKLRQIDIDGRWQNTPFYKAIK